MDIFSQINNAVLDLQAAQVQTFERPLKALARLLHHPDLEAINRSLTGNVDFDAFMAESERTGGSMVGSHQLAWPEDHERFLGLALLLIDRLAADSRFAINIGFTFFYSGSGIINGIHAITRDVIIPFTRDYVAYVKANQKALVQPTTEVTSSFQPSISAAIDFKQAWQRVDGQKSEP